MPVVKLTPDFIENYLVCPEDKRKIEYVVFYLTSADIQILS